MGDERMPLFSVNDRSCPDFSSEKTDDYKGFYYGYFENDYGERSVFEYDRDTGEAFVCGGDWGWKPYSVTVMGNVVQTGLVLGIEERRWLSACCAACGMIKLTEVL